MPKKSDLIPKICQYISDNALFTKEDKCLLAFSAGSDSVFLLEMLKNYLLPKNLVLVYFDHGLRTEADQEKSFTKAIAEKYNLQYVLETLPVKTMAQETKQSIETAARNLRQEALIRLAQERQISLVLTAHHLDDQCETYLHKIIRGAKTHLNGMKPKLEIAPGIFQARPLLTITKAQILDYLNQHQLPYCTDHTNAQNIYTRNIIRNEILPKIAQINPGYRQVFQSEMDYFNQLAVYLDKQTQPFLSQAIITPKSISLNRAVFNQADPFLQQRLLFLMATKLYGHTYEFADCHIQLILSKLNTNHKITLDLPQNLVCLISKKEIGFLKT